MGLLRAEQQEKTLELPPTHVTWRETPQSDPGRCLRCAGNPGYGGQDTTTFRIFILSLKEVYEYSNFSTHTRTLKHTHKHTHTHTHRCTYSHAQTTGSHFRGKSWICPDVMRAVSRTCVTSRVECDITSTCVLRGVHVHVIGRRVHHATERLLTCTWSHMCLLTCTWSHMCLLTCTWSHVVSLDVYVVSRSVS